MEFLIILQNSSRKSETILNHFKQYKFFSMIFNSNNLTYSLFIKNKYDALFPQVYVEININEIIFDAIINNALKQNPIFQNTTLFNSNHLSLNDPSNFYMYIFETYIQLIINYSKKAKTQPDKIIFINAK
jgi:hypothetical protein